LDNRTCCSSIINSTSSKANILHKAATRHCSWAEINSVLWTLHLVGDAFL
jgi:predicted benzoate:H+ symporter BenE